MTSGSLGPAPQQAGQPLAPITFRGSRSPAMARAVGREGRLPGGAGAAAPMAWTWPRVWSAQAWCQTCGERRMVSGAAGPWASDGLAGTGPRQQRVWG